jgi:hypothetical protein
MGKVYLLKTYVPLRNGRLMVYALTDTPHNELIMAMDCSYDIKNKLIDIFRREYGTVHHLDKEYYVTSKGELHMMDTIFKVVTKCKGIDR